MRRIGILGVFAVLLLPFGGAVTRPMPLAAPAPATDPLTGLVYGNGAYRLVHVDPLTLAPTRASAPLSYGYGWVRSPDGKQLALGTGAPGSYETTAVQFADPAKLEASGNPVALPGTFRVGLWSVPKTLFAVTESAGLARLETVDVESREVVAGQWVGGSVASYARFTNGLVLLLQRNMKLSPARVAIVYPDGAIETASVARIRVGTVWDRSGRGPFATTRQPGIAVDEAGSTAYVIDPGGLVASVDLETLSVRYHRPPRTLLSRLDGWMTPVAEAKGMNGPVLSARWLGDDLIAVWGTNQSDVRKNGTRVASGVPAGLSVVDVRNWTVRRLDPRADQAAVSDGVLLATGAGWSSAAPGSRKGEGVAAFGPDGVLRWRLADGSAPWIASVYGGLAAVSRPGANNLYDVVDVQSGRVVRASIKGPFPQLLLGSGS
jgi:hypothetical protein